jgi:hypothetical protein
VGARLRGALRADPRRSRDAAARAEAQRALVPRPDRGGAGGGLLKPRWPRYANVVSTLCLFIVLGGSAYAAKQSVLPRNSVGTQQIRQHAITKAKLAPKLVTSLKGHRGPAGTPGTAGQQGVTGPTGPAGPTFGDVAIAAGGAGQPACTTLTPVSKTITLDHRGPLFAMAQGEYYANGSTTNSAATDVIVLRDAADTTTLATTQTQTARVSWPSVPGAPLTTGGVMLTPSGTPPGTRYVAEPGTYRIELQVEVSGACASTNLDFNGPGLSVVQLGA